MVKITRQQGFTLVELLVVIVIIAILAAISVVVYNGMRDRAFAAAIQADLATANKQLLLYYQENSVYPTGIQCPTPSGTTICLSTSQPNTSLVYTPNNATSPPSYLLVATNGSKTYSVSSGSSPGAGVNGKTAVSVTNLATNGDFSGGLSGWTNYCGAPSTCAVSGGVLSLTTAGSGRAVVGQVFSATYTDQDKVYYGLTLNKTSGSGFISAASRNSGGYDVAVVPSAQFDSQAPGASRRYSVVRTFVASQGAATSMSIGRYDFNVYTYNVQIDNVVVINLTKDFGAGNEPSASAVDAMLQQQMPNSYFSGTSRLYK